MEKPNFEKMGFYREIFRNAPDKIAVPEFLQGRTVEVTIILLTEDENVSEKSTEFKDESAKNK